MIGVASIGDTTEVLVRGVVSEGRVRAELLKADLALGASAVRVHHAPDADEGQRNVGEPGKGCLVRCYRPDRHGLDDAESRGDAIANAAAACSYC